MKKLYHEDINTLIVKMLDWFEANNTVFSEQKSDEFIELVETELEPFSEGYRNYN